MSFFKKKNDDAKDFSMVEDNVHTKTNNSAQPIAEPTLQPSTKLPIPQPVTQSKPKQALVIENCDKDLYDSSPNEFDVKISVTKPAVHSSSVTRTSPVQQQPTRIPVKEKPYSNPWTDIKYIPKPVHESTGAIILVVENTLDTNIYREEILRLIARILEDNSCSLFKLMKISKECHFSTLLSYNEVKGAELTSNLLTPNDALTSSYNVDNAFTSLNNFAQNFLASSNIITVKDKKYIISDARIIFIGTGEHLSYTDVSTNILKALCDNKKIKTIKYFCIKDSNAIKLAAMGFPIIGHLESNFYK